MGYEVAGLADSATAALEMIREAKPHVVLMDIYLRGAVHGVTVAQEIKSRWHIPVVFLTANSNEQVLLKARAAEPYGYLLKPYRAQELDATIRVALERYAATNKLFINYQWLRALLVNLSDAVVATDGNGCIQYLNALAEDLTGWPRVENRVPSLASIRSRRSRPCQRDQNAGRGVSREQRRSKRPVTRGFSRSCTRLGDGALPHYPRRLRNAKKHAPGAPVRITLATTAHTVQLTIEDTGPGFDMSRAKAHARVMAPR